MVHVTTCNTDQKHDMLIDPSTVIATDQAVPTGRLLDGSSDHGYVEEWQEPAILPDGRQCYRMYLFDDDDITDEEGNHLDADCYPWDNDHVRRILLAD
ncbi:MAG: hypothetical protein PHN44_00170 [Candidatus Marinimicrobia bacterium]|nr:hypothetical protein [Candidatus Neomarinimicrobiota bacterium]